MPNEIYELRMRQIKQWLDEGTITPSNMMILLGQAIEELFISKFNEAMNSGE